MVTNPNQATRRRGGILRPHCSNLQGSIDLFGLRTFIRSSPTDGTYSGSRQYENISVSLNPYALRKQDIASPKK